MSSRHRHRRSLVTTLVNSNKLSLLPIRGVFFSCVDYISSLPNIALRGKIGGATALQSTDILIVLSIVFEISIYDSRHYEEHSK